MSNVQSNFRSALALAAGNGDPLVYWILTKSTDQYVSNGNTDKITWDGIAESAGVVVSLANNRVTVPAGTYIVNVAIGHWHDGGGGNNDCIFRINGSEPSGHSRSEWSSKYPAQHLSESSCYQKRTLSADDYVEYFLAASVGGSYLEGPGVTDRYEPATFYGVRIGD